MRRINFVRFGTRLLGAVLAAAMVHAPAVAQNTQRSDGGLVGGLRAGQPIFQKHCAACHTPEGMMVGDRQALAFNNLQDLPPERILDALVSGKMQVQGAAMTDEERKLVAQWLPNRPLGSSEAGDMKYMANRCTTKAAFSMPADRAAWNGWSPAPDNSRFQPAAAAGLDVDRVKRLRLAWAFGLPQGADSYSQPTVAGGRVFFGSDNSFMYSVDARSGCGYWSFQAGGAIRSAPTVAAVGGHAGTTHAVFFADGQNRVYALDANTGRELWRVRVDTQPRSHVTASVTVADGRVFVPISGGETLISSNPSYECCRTRGAVVAVDADTGKVLWRTETIAEPARPTRKNAQGVQQWGPGGASVWNTPTVDLKRGLVYVGTGNGYTAPAAPTTDSILALDIGTGRLMWHHQEFSGDAYISGCAKTNAAGGNCPGTLGPDWDFGGASAILRTLPDGRDVLVATGKGGVSVGLDPDHQGAVLWRTELYDEAAPTTGGLVVFGGAADQRYGYYPMNRPRGGVVAIDLQDGKRHWAIGSMTAEDRRGQSAAASVIPGVLFTGAWDGVLRAVSTRDGSPIWSFDTRRSYQTVNGVEARGGSLGSPGATVADGMLFIGSGYVGTQNGYPGNVILAFAAE